MNVRHHFRPIYFSFILVPALVYGAFVTTNVDGLLANLISAQDQSVTKCLNEVSRLHGQTFTKSDFTATPLHIDTDKTEDIALMLTTDEFCGTSGCVTEICLIRDSYATTIPFGYAAKTISQTDTQSGGMYDLTINDSITLTWDGQRYTPAEQ